MPISPPANTTEVRDAHRFDEASLARYLAANVPGFDGSLVVRQFDGGQSNPTFWITDGKRELALRKKPPGHLLPSAHQIEREHRVLAALRDTGVPVARVHVLCEDAAVIGTPFYVMDYVAGRLFWNVQLPGVEPPERRAIYDELIRVLAAIHTVDVDAVGLGDYGKKGGYVARQVSRWSQQYRASQTGEVAPMETLIAWLPKNVPSRDETTLVHGDFRLDNLIFHPSDARALAVIDWELSTLGHPLADLAYLCMLYDVALPKVGGLLGIDFAATGVPTEAELLARYGALTGRGRVDDFPYYKAFSLFRLAAIAQGVFKRSQQGNASSPNASMYGEAVGQLAAIACGLVGI